MKITEHHLVSDFLMYPKREKSRLIPGEEIPYSPVFYCPMCRKKQDIPLQGQWKKCLSSKCDAEFYATGKTLEIMATPPKGIKND
jgi:hypothetical protein